MKFLLAQILSQTVPVRERLARSLITSSNGKDSKATFYTEHWCNPTDGFHETQTLKSVPVPMIE